MTAVRARRRGIIGGAGAIALSDDFNRANSTNLGETSVGDRAWQELVGDWDISSNRVRNLSGTDPIAVVDAKTADVDITLDISPYGRDAIVFRASDANNWLRLSNYYSYSSSSTIRTQYNTDVFCDGAYCTTCSSCSSCTSACGCGGCDGTVSYGPCTSAPNEAACGTTTTTTTTRRIYLHKMEAGSLTLLNSSTSLHTTRLRVIANGSQISLYSGSGTTLEATITDSFNRVAALHGVGRSQFGGSGSAIDNFILNPI